MDDGAIGTKLTSKMGLEARTFFSICVSDEDPAAMAKYLIASLAVTVLPAPDSPEMTIDWSRFSLSNTNANHHRSCNEEGL